MADAGDIATWVAAGIAVVAAGFTGRQTREARKARIAAQDQATEAAKSRAAAEIQARAAEDQVALMREERDERDAPEFSVSAVDAFTVDTDYFAAKIVLRVERGQALRSLTVTASGDFVETSGLHRFTVGGVAAGIVLTFDDVRRGRELLFYASTKDGYVGTTINLTVTCHERDGERTWQRHYACTIDQRPETPAAWGTWTPLQA
ncbi:hypothetical protein AB0F91_39690 [Amycolatopsis sp. NPDC023774]|uniref:hypothetical protein n=1 Tax=Amycolatopsis sp. NPDC023774 TaxID=3155015 RepID=UPI0033C741A4